MSAHMPQGTIVPTLRYYNVAITMDWLFKAFWFEKCLVADAATRCDGAKAARAELLLGIDDGHSDGRGYASADIERHVWNFGTYDPCKPRRAAASRGLVERRDSLRRLTTAIALLVAAATAIVMLGRVPGISGVRADVSASVDEDVVGKQADTFAGKRRDFSAASDYLAREQGARELAFTIVSDMEHLANGSDGKLTKAETMREIENARQQLARERSAREEAQRGANEARERLNLAQQAGETVQEQLAAERSARLKADIAAQEASQQLAKEQGAKEAAVRALKKADYARAKRATVRTSVRATVHTSVHAHARQLLLLASPI